MKKTFIIILILIGIILGIYLWKFKSNNILLKPSSFKHLPGWDDAEIKKSFEAFKVSCQTFLRQNPNEQAGSQRLHLKVKDWQPVCQIAMTINPVTEMTARNFFQQWFTPVEFYNKKTIEGLFTGYYTPLIAGSLTKTSTYNVPIYGMPKNILTINLSQFDKTFANRRLVGRLEGNSVLPFYTRKEINNGVLKNNAPVLVWIKSHIDRLFLEIQGSGVIQLSSGQRLYIGYAGENGAPYTPIGQVLIKRGVMTKKTTSLQKIRAYLEAHPEEIIPIINKNHSFVFFRILDKTAALGAQGVSLTPGYSLAVDRNWIPLGTPLWLDTTHPQEGKKGVQPLQRLMIAQDTGGAIRGTVRGDVFWGEGERATYIAGKMKNSGHYWLLLPKQSLAKLPKNIIN